MVQLNIIVLAALCSFAAATNVDQCPGKSFADLSDHVELTPCKAIPCKLKKGTNQHISITFTPEKDVTEVKNHVTADVFGVPLPFIGVDGNSICSKLTTKDGEKASCPLKAGTEYVYKDSFPVLSFYPSITVKVHWALAENDKKDIICFEVPARIA
ncbi:hypothetical protein O0L34_g926 [Tuta absoluta]|nr:hypothetical protein O0L34_g926 [Tuta absoluta]